MRPPVHLPRVRGVGKRVVGEGVRVGALAVEFFLRGGDGGVACGGGEVQAVVGASLAFVGGAGHVGLGNVGGWRFGRKGGVGNGNERDEDGRVVRW